MSSAILLHAGYPGHIKTLIVRGTGINIRLPLSCPALQELIVVLSRRLILDLQIAHCQ